MVGASKASGNTANSSATMRMADEAVGTAADEWRSRYNDDAGRPSLAKAGNDPQPQRLEREKDGEPRPHDWRIGRPGVTPIGGMVFSL